MKILLFICGEGLGHTSRCLALGKEFLAAGHEVNFGAYGYSKELVKKTGYSVWEIHPEIRLIGETGTFDIGKSIKESLNNLSPAGFRQLLKLVEALKPDVVLSDGYYSGILAARSKNVPVYFIGHQFNMEEFFQKKGPLLRAAGTLVRRFYNYIFSSVDGIIVPDYPLPYSVNRRNFTISRDLNANIFFSGPLIRRRYREVEAKPCRHPNVLSTIGAFGYRAAIFRKVLEAAKLDPDIHYTFISGPGIDPKKFPEIPDNVEFTGFTDNPFPYYRGSDLVITAGGHGTIMESLAFGLPVLSFPDEKHTEQENNATVLEEEGYGKRMSYLTRQEVILTCIREVLEEEQYRRKTRRLKELSEKLDGPAAVRKLLEEQLENRSHIKK
ncbi:UDP-N-acetylglucosamine--N-acetylmuramyl-(pentapeptide) pyrophosphoryl-undecaprenol N-acetylglucosamine transferase [Methanosarcina sp. T3]|uniref:UDP-N-acetylglucosamine--N-acetylmuramyl- (pentapeptide) pyrophosphoryl-undecaprenol N-acetylglucosamine transferase n=1 Tax=Methanosarcina sp. T3 TaxID=3439062 RepID=UPI003F855A00